MGIFDKKLRVGRRKYKFKLNMAARFLYENEFKAPIDPNKIEDTVKLIYCALWACNDGNFPYAGKFDDFVKVVDRDPLIVVRALKSLGVDVEKKVKSQEKKNKKG